MNLRLVYLPAVAALLLSAPIPATAHLSHHDAEEQHTLPSPAPLATQLARVRALVDAFRESGDDAALEQAAALLDDRELQSDAPVEVLTTAAAVRQAMHQFARALELLDRALLQRPGDTQARLLRASIYTVQGNRARAAADCRAMLHSEVVLRMACLGAVARGGAQSQHAYATLIALIESMGNSPTRGLGMWLHSIAGDLAADQGLAAQLALRNIRVQREPEDIALIRRTGQTLPSAEDAVKPGQKAPDPATVSTTRRTGTGWLPDS